MTLPKTVVAVDIALVTVLDGGLACLLMRRADAAEVGGTWALPGGFVHEDEPLEATAARVLAAKVGMTADAAGPYLEQLYTYGAPGRDPRLRVISVTYLALIPAGRLADTVAARDDLMLAHVLVDWDGETGGPARAVSDGGPLALAFDHAEILGDMVKRLRGKIDYTAIALDLLPAEFTLRAAQEVWEAILGRSLAKPAFRRKLLDRGIVRATGRRETAAAFRPAELYRKS